jgi:hypothetical protein
MHLKPTELLLLGLTDMELPAASQCWVHPHRMLLLHLADNRN